MLRTNRVRNTFFFLILAAVVAIAMAGPAAAERAVDVQTIGGAIAWSVDGVAASVPVALGGPGDFVALVEPTVDGAGWEIPADAPDGQYVWEMRLDGARVTGYFSKSGSEITHFTNRAERFDKPTRPRVEETPATALGGARAPNKNTTISGDLIVIGEACIGEDCTISESIDETLRLKSPEIRMLFADTSTTSLVTDWRFDVNAGGEKFELLDLDASETPWTVEAGAPDRSLYIEDSGRIGLGTAVPMADLHIVSGSAPTLRLEQDTSLGASARTWEVGGDDASFFVRDATAGSVRPFEIEAGAPGASVYVDADGRVGIGTTSPDYPLEIVASGSNARIQIESTSSGNEWFLEVEDDSDGGFFLSKVGTGGIEVEVNQRLDGNSWGDPTLEVFGSIRATNVTFTSSRDVKTELAPVEASDVLARLAELPMQTWRYDTEKEGIVHLGPYAEDFAAAFGLGNSDKHITSSDIDGVALAAIQALHEEITRLRERIEELEATP